MTALLVLLSAVLHAGWNTAAKSVGDRWVSSALMGVAYGVVGLVFVLLRPLPVAAAWPYIIVSVLLQVVYLLLLTTTYAHGDMSRLYPLLRGLGPLLVTVVALTALHEHVSPLALGGIGVLCVGLAGLAFGHGLPRRGDGVGLAVATGFCIAAYSLADGVGVRQSIDPIGYAAWLFFLQGPILVALCRWRSGPGLLARMRPHAAVGLTGGVLSLLVYGVVVWAQDRLPLPIVSALRETSVVWGVVFGRLLLHERFSRRRVAATLLALAGAVLVELAP